VYFYIKVTFAGNQTHKNTAPT